MPVTKHKSTAPHSSNMSALYVSLDDSAGCYLFDCIAHAVRVCQRRCIVLVKYCRGIQTSKTSWGDMRDFLAGNCNNESSVHRCSQSDGDEAIVSRSLHVATPPHDVQET
jgi:hypothetical protein